MATSEVKWAIAAISGHLTDEDWNTRMKALDALSQVAEKARFMQTDPLPIGLRSTVARVSACRNTWVFLCAQHPGFPSNRWVLGASFVLSAKLKVKLH